MLTSKSSGRYWRASLLAFIVVLPACSSGFFYNRLNVLVPWYIDDYVDLTRAQRSELDGALGPLLDWHRSVELARYVEFLGGVEQQLDGEIAVDNVNSWAEFALDSFSGLAEQSRPMLLKLAENLSEQQMQKYLDRLVEDQTEMEDENLERDQEEYHEDNYEALVDNIQDWLGRLDRQQKTAVREAASRLRRYDDQWLADRREWVQEMDKLLSKRGDGWRDSLALLMDSRSDISQRPYRESSEHNINVIAELVSHLINARSAKQDRHLRRELGQWSKRFTGLQGQD